VSDLRIYMSFDVAHDRDLHDQLLAQSKRRDSFSVVHRSEGGDMNDAWTARTRGRIAAADQVVVLCGEHSDESPQMSAELKLAQEAHKPYVLLWGRRDSMCKKPRSARPDDGIYGWTPAMLERQLANALRRGREREAAESMRRPPQVPRAV
jgi:hypothetical protein